MSSINKHRGHFKLFIHLSRNLTNELLEIAAVLRISETGRRLRIQLSTARMYAITYRETGNIEQLSSSDSQNTKNRKHT